MAREKKWKNMCITSVGEKLTNSNTFSYTYNAKRKKRIVIEREKNIW